MSGAINHYQYFDFDYTGAIRPRSALDNYIEEYDTILKQIFMNLIKRLNGKTAVIPLSGGCDSRTVAGMKK